MRSHHILASSAEPKHGQPSVNMGQHVHVASNIRLGLVIQRKFEPSSPVLNGML